MVFMVPIAGIDRLWKLLSHIEMALLISIVAVETTSMSSRLFLCRRRRERRELRSFMGFYLFSLGCRITLHFGCV